MINKQRDGSSPSLGVYSDPAPRKFLLVGSCASGIWNPAKIWHPLKYGNLESRTRDPENTACNTEPGMHVATGEPSQKRNLILLPSSLNC